MYIVHIQNIITHTKHIFKSLLIAKIKYQKSQRLKKVNELCCLQSPCTRLSRNQEKLGARDWEKSEWNMLLEITLYLTIVVGNEHGDSSSNPGRDWLHFT